MTPLGMRDRLCYGGDYNPEQWPREVWDEDIRLMGAAGVNLVSLGVFAWSRLEPREGEYAFGWLDEIMDRLHGAGVAVALATPTASPPPWFSLAHPDALPVTADGVRLGHGSRDTYCACAPAYRAAALRIATVLGRRYAHHPALALWHLHNEYGTTCHCVHAAGAFRRWLRARYVTLDRLNEAWTTSFWSQGYSDWEQVRPPRATQYLSNPAQLLEFRRFWSDELLAAFREQRDAVRSVNAEVPVTTNYVLGAWVPVDQWAWSAEVDLVAIDHYPSSVADAPAQSAFAADLARGFAGGQPWLVLEQAPNLTYTPDRMRARAPGEMTRLSVTHIARGSHGAMFFQWRAPRGGAEAFHSAMVPHAGATSRVFDEARTLGAALAALSPSVSPVRAEVALIWDPVAWWALQGPGLPSTDIDYLAAVRDVHAALWRLGITVDIVSPRADPGSYRLVLAPSLFLLSAGTASRLEAYVAGGGSLVVWFLSGVVDPDHRVWPGGYPGPLSEVLGIRVHEWHPLAPDETVALTPGEGVAVAARGGGWSELIRLSGATVQAAYADGPLAGEPALTRHRHGLGTARYMSTRLADPELGEYLAAVCAEVGVAGVGGDGVEVVRRVDGTVFAINHTTSPAMIPAHIVGLRDAIVPPGAFTVFNPAPSRS